jgi:hypothetical protein
MGMGLWWCGRYNRSMSPPAAPTPTSDTTGATTSAATGDATGDATLDSADTAAAQRAQTLVTAAQAWRQAFGDETPPADRAGILAHVQDAPPAIQLAVAEALHWHTPQAFLAALEQR